MNRRPRVTASILFTACLVSGLGAAGAATSAEPVPQDAPTQAQALEASGQHDQAIAAYEAYLKEQADDDDARAVLARLLSSRERYDEAVVLYEGILTRHPDDLDVRLAIARVRSWQMRWGEGRGLYKAILDEAPNTIEAERGLADISYWSGDFQQALAQYERLYVKTKDPEVQKQIEAVKSELD